MTSENWSVDIDTTSNNTDAEHLYGFVTKRADIISANATNDGNDGSDAARKMDMERLLAEQTELTRSYLAEAAQSTEIDDLSRDFAETTAEIIGHWQRLALDNNLTSYQIDFDLGLNVNLLMVLAILPERFQNGILIEDQNRSPSGNGGALSWLHEDTMSLLVRLFRGKESSFGQGLASMVSYEIDDAWKQWYGQGYLEHQVDQMAKGELNASEFDLYRYPACTEQIVFFFNPTGNHWTLVEVEMCDEYWCYTLYNSLAQGKRGPIWKACKQQLPLLEQLICCASGFPEPEYREFLVGTSPQQGNIYDCGPIALYNAIVLLKGRYPAETVDAEQLRLLYLKKIRSSLRQFIKPNLAYWELNPVRQYVNLDAVYWLSTVG